MSDTASVAPAVADVDPIDALDLSNTNEVEPETTVPPELMLGGPPPTQDEPESEPEKAPEVEAPSASQGETKLPDGYTRDSLGRIHGPNGQVLKKEAAEKLLAAATASQQQPHGLHRIFYCHTKVLS